MTETKTMNRWMVVVGALMVQFALGSVYAFSIFTSPLSGTTGNASTSFEILGIFATAIAVFAITMIFSGRLQDRKGPKIVATIGGLIYGLSYILASFYTDNLAMLYLTYGVIGGIGLGVGYVCPLAAAVKWFPDKRGLISGIAVAGFGAGAFIFTQVGNFLIADPGIGLSGCFFGLGIIFLSMVVIGAQLLRNPPQGWMPPGYDPKTNNHHLTVDYDWHEITKMRNFYLLFSMFLLSATAGLMLIGNVKNIAKFLTADTAALVIVQSQTIAGILALFNGAGRIGWGKISDMIGQGKTLKLIFMIQAIILFLAAGFVAWKPEDQIMQFIGLTGLASAVGFTFGGNFALFPSTTAQFYGTKNLGINYGLVFLGYGAAGVLGGLIPGILSTSPDSFTLVFIVVGFASLVAFAMATITKAPAQKAPQD